MVAGENNSLKTAVRVETVLGGKSFLSGEGLEGGREGRREGERRGLSNHKNDFVRQTSPVMM